MTFDPFNNDLPVREIIAPVRTSLLENNTLIVTAPPGAGKSTLLPLALLDEPWLQGQKILMLEPRRLAARSIAHRMASMVGEDVGGTIGYRVRFERCVSENTSLEVLTEGILTRIMQNDNALEGVGLVVFDEFHERSIHAEVALALCKEVQQVLRPDMRIMLMSATLDEEKLHALMKAPVISSHGRQYPVKIIYTGDTDTHMISQMVARLILRVVKEQPGDTLVFLPGEGEIRRCEQLLVDYLPGFAIHPLFGKLSVKHQIDAIMPNKQGRRKVVLATSIAETSLTIEGIHSVVDTGLGRTVRFDSRTGLSHLETVEISRDSADQRAGRAGRLGPGVCYRMWSTATHTHRKEHRTPEILDADLTPMVLDMAQWGASEINDLTWLTPPPRGPLQQAYDTLHQLNALKNCSITSHGKEIQKLPCHPRIAHMLLMARKEGLSALAIDLAAILEERDPLTVQNGIDINLRIEALRRFRKGDRTHRAMKRIEYVAASYGRLIGVSLSRDIVDPYQTGRLLIHVYPERIALAHPSNNGQYQMSNGNMAKVKDEDDLYGEQWLAIAHVDARKGMGKIFLAAPLNFSDLSDMIKQREVIAWDSRKRVVVASMEYRIGRIVVQSKSLINPDKEKIAGVLSQAIERDGATLLDFNEDVIQWQNRVMSLALWCPSEEWPDVSTATLIATNQRWLTPYLEGVRSADDLRKIDLKKVLHHYLPWDKQVDLERLAPHRLTVPSGSTIKLKYNPKGESPVLAVRIQEVFGLARTPRVNDEKIPVLMHLLSPAFRPIQITFDLESFWETTYFEVRKELRRRYVKHSWPDDPMAAQPASGAKRRRN